MTEQPTLKEEIMPLDPVASRLTRLPLPGRDRAAWRLAALALILQACRGPLRVRVS